MGTDAGCAEYLPCGAGPDRSRHITQAGSGEFLHRRMPGLGHHGRLCERSRARVRGQRRAGGAQESILPGHHTVEDSILRSSGAYLPLDPGWRARNLAARRLAPAGCDPSNLAADRDARISDLQSTGRDGAHAAQFEICARQAVRHHRVGPDAGQWNMEHQWGTSHDGIADAEWRVVHGRDGLWPGWTSEQWLIRL